MPGRGGALGPAVSLGPDVNSPPYPPESPSRQPERSQCEHGAQDGVDGGVCGPRGRR